MFRSSVPVGPLRTSRLSRAHAAPSGCRGERSRLVSGMQARPAGWGAGLRLEFQPHSSDLEPVQLPAVQPDGAVCPPVPVSLCSQSLCLSKNVSWGTAGRGRCVCSLVSEIGLQRSQQPASASRPQQ